MSTPNWGQPPQGPQGPQGPQWGQGQQRGYGSPQYGQQPPSGYGPPPQYGQGQYGQGQYGQPPYGGPPGPPPRRGGGKGPILAVLGVVVVAGIVVLTLFLTGVFGSDSDGSSPAAAVKSFAEGVKNNDRDAIKANLCNADADRIERLSRPGGMSNIKSYSIGKTTTIDDTHAKVEVSSTSNGSSRVTDEELSVVKEDGDWKVCFSDSSDSADSGTSGGSDDSAPAPSDSGGTPNDASAVPRPGSTYTLPNGSRIVIPSIPVPSYTP